MTSQPSSAGTEPAVGRRPLRRPAARFVRGLPSAAGSYVGAGVVGGVGLGALAVHVALGVAEFQASPAAAIVGRLVPVLLSVVLLFASAWLLVGEWEGRAVLRTAGWCVLGVAVLATAGEVVVRFQGPVVGALPNRVLLATNLGLWGGAVGTLVGVYETRLARHDRRMTAQKDRFEFLNRLLRHEVLNRMNVLLLEIDAVDGRSDAEARSRLSTARAQGEAVVALVKRARALTDPEGGVTTGEPVDLSGLLADEVERARAAYREATFNVDGVPDGLRVRADAVLAEVVRNLLENAVRHSDAGAPRVTVSAAADGDVVRVRVSDDGPGIPDQRKAAVFERATTAPDSPGEGLGLYLVDQLVASYGGEVWIEDNRPRGSVVVVELPAVETEAATVAVTDVGPPA